jgi:hypothetical protein
MKSTSVRLPASRSRSIDGFAPGIAAPKSRMYWTGSSKSSSISRARATSNASVAQLDATDQAASSTITSPIVRPRMVHVPLKATLQTSFSHTSGPTSS